MTAKTNMTSWWGNDPSIFCSGGRRSCFEESRILAAKNQTPQEKGWRDDQSLPAVAGVVSNLKGTDSARPSSYLMMYGQKTSAPMIAAAIAVMRTAPAATSLASRTSG